MGKVELVDRGPEPLGHTSEARSSRETYVAGAKVRHTSGLSHVNKAKFVEVRGFEPGPLACHRLECVHEVQKSPNWFSLLSFQIISVHQNSPQFNSTAEVTAEVSPARSARGRITTFELEDTAFEWLAAICKHGPHLVDSCSQKPQCSLEPEILCHRTHHCRTASLFDLDLEPERVASGPTRPGSSREGRSPSTTISERQFAFGVIPMN